MRRNELLCLTAAVGLLAFTAVYALDISEPHYYPVEGAWAIQPSQDMGPGMGWYARSGWALAAGLAAAGLAFAGSPVLRRFFPPDTSHHESGGSDGRNAPRLPDWAVLLFTVFVLSSLFAILGWIAYEELHGIMH